MTPAEPFISGLPDRDEPPQPHPKGYELLARIRERAEDEMRRLQPLTHRRFDGAETIEADPKAIEEREIMRATKVLVDLICADGRLLAWFSLRLVMRGGGPTR